MSCVKFEIEIEIKGKTIKGELLGQAEFWGFSSQDPYFVALFPSGAVYSFNVYGMDGLLHEHRALHREIERKVAALFSSG